MMEQHPHHADAMDVSVVIVNYNVRAFLEQALRSVERAAEGLRVETFVVDNDSADGSVEMVRQTFPEVRVIANTENAGFSTANNQAIRQARGRLVLVLNPDTIVQEDALRTMRAFFEEHPEAGAAGCQILNPDGTFAPESRRAFPTPEVAFYRMSGLGRLFPHSRRFGRYNMTYLPRDEVAEVDALSGSCMFVRHSTLYLAGEEAAALRAQGQDPLEEALRRRDAGLEGVRGAGLFDEGFFMYGEDLDWCYRIQQAGWKILYTPATQIIHYKGESTKKGELRYVRLFYGAMLRFTEKHVHGRYSGLLAVAIRAAIVARAALAGLRRGLEALTVPLRDAVLTVLVVALVGALYLFAAGASPSPLFFATVPTTFAAGVGLGIALAGGYRPGREERLRLSWIGTLAGLVVVSTASFFVKDIAFSRGAVLIAAPVVALGLALVRWRARRRRTEPGRAVLVGSEEEAERLRALLDNHPRPPFRLLGRIAPAGQDGHGHGTLGMARHLRDLVRLHDATDVLFAQASLSNTEVIRLMRALEGRNVGLKVLASGREHLIGKASVEHLAGPPLADAAEAVGTPRSSGARRAFDLAASFTVLVLSPFVALAASLGSRRARSLRRRLGALWDVARGRRALVGYGEADAFQPPASWSMQPGAFAVSETLPPHERSDPEALRRAYAFYAAHQNAALDLSVARQALENMDRTSA